MPDLLEQFSAVHGKQEARPEEFLDLFNKAIMALNEKYVPGTYDYVSQNHKKLFQEILELEDSLHEFWGTDIKTFRDILKRYYRTTLNCIKIYKESLS